MALNEVKILQDLDQIKIRIRSGISIDESVQHFNSILYSVRSSNSITSLEVEKQIYDMFHLINEVLLRRDRKQRRWLNIFRFFQSGFFYILIGFLSVFSVVFVDELRREPVIPAFVLFVGVALILYGTGTKSYASFSNGFSNLPFADIADTDSERDKEGQVSEKKKPGSNYSRNSDRAPSRLQSGIVPAGINIVLFGGASAIAMIIGWFSVKEALNIRKIFDREQRQMQISFVGCVSARSEQVVEKKVPADCASASNSTQIKNDDQGYQFHPVIDNHQQIFVPYRNQPFASNERINTFLFQIDDRAISYNTGDLDFGTFKVGFVAGPSSAVARDYELTVGNEGVVKVKFFDENISKSSTLNLDACEASLRCPIRIIRPGKNINGRHDIKVYIYSNVLPSGPNLQTTEQVGGSNNGESESRKFDGDEGNIDFY